MKYTCRSNKEIHLAGSQNEVELIEAMLAGVCFVTQVGNELVRHEKHCPVDLTPDPETAHYWPPAVRPGEAKVPVIQSQLPFTATEFKPGVEQSIVQCDETGMSIYVQGLSGYGCDNLEERERRMREMGFVPLRSPRGNDGKYWEIWYLCSAICAEGSMKGACLKEIIRAVMHIGPGSINLVRQYMGLSVD